MRHILFHEGSPHSEGLGAKWREVKIGLHLTLRLGWLLSSRQRNDTTVAWLPNPAMMQNANLQTHRSMMGALGILDAGAPVLKESPSWVRARLASGELVEVELDGRHELGALEQQALEALANPTTPVALVLRHTSSPMHWHGAAGRWLHAAFISHRLHRAELATGRAALTLPEGVPSGKYLITVHIREFKVTHWNFPGEYYVSALRAVFAAGGTPLSCGGGDGSGSGTAVVIVVGAAESAAARAIGEAYGGCIHRVARRVYETNGAPSVDADAADDYDIRAPAEADAARGAVFDDLQLLALSDVTLGSNSEFSRLAQSASARDTIVLCAPARAEDPRLAQDRRPPCDATGVAGSVLTRRDEPLPSAAVMRVDEERMAAAVAAAWRRRADVAGGVAAGPIWERPRHGLVPFDFDSPVEPASVEHWRWRVGSPPPSPQPPYMGGEVEL